MSIPNPNAKKGGKEYQPILRSQIEEAQRHTNSNKGAARWLGVGYKRYKKYAQLYGLFEGHMNEAGWGIEKGFSKRPTSIPLKEVLEGKHPKYSLSKLKNRLIARKKIVEQCSLCGFHERRITDGKVPLMMSFKDGNRTNFELANLQLLCYNCMFLTTGAPSAVYRGTLEKSLLKPETIQRSFAVEPTVADAYDPSEDDARATLHQDTDLILTDAERKALLDELHKS